MVKYLQLINKACLIGLIGASILGIFGYRNMQRQYRDLDLKFTATAESLKVYKATLQNQGFYIPLRKDVNQLKEYTEGLFEGSEENFKDFSEELNNLKQRVESLEKRATKK